VSDSTHEKKEAEVVTSTLSRYFPTKGALINGAYASTKDNLIRTMTTGLQDRKTLESKMRFVWDNTTRWGLKPPKELLFLEQFAASPHITKITEEKALKQSEFFDELIKEGVGVRKLKDIRRGPTVEMILSACAAVIKIPSHRLQTRQKCLSIVPLSWRWMECQSR